MAMLPSFTKKILVVFASTALLLPPAFSQTTVAYWDSVISNQHYYDPTPNLIAYQTTASAGFNAPLGFGDSTTWAFGTSVNGAFSGTSVGRVYINGGFDPRSDMTLQGRINADGTWKILFTNSSGKVTIGVGEMQRVDGVWSPIAQMFTSPDPINAHWAYNVPYNPSITTPPGPELYQQYPSVTSPKYAWMGGTTWSINNKSFFGSSAPGTLTFSTYNNGYAWGVGIGPSGSSNANFSTMASITPFGRVLLAVINGGQPNVMWGTINSNPFGARITLEDYGYGTDTWTPNGETSSLSYTSQLGANTNSALASTTAALQAQFGNQTSALVFGMSYDCSFFGADNICVSTGGRGQFQSNPNINSLNALVIGAYRVQPTFRVGAYVDQNLTASNPNGIVTAKNDTPMFGIFGVWNQMPDKNGFEIKTTLAYATKGLDITRPIVGNSQPGSGSTNLTSQGINAILKYGISLDRDSFTQVFPYLGYRYTSSVMGAYSENAASNVEYPLSFGSVTMNARTALFGIEGTHKINDKTRITGSVGAEGDVSTNFGSYAVTNYAYLNSNAINPAPMNLRPTATLSTSYDLDKNIRLGLTGLYRSDTFTGMTNTAVIATASFGI